MNRLKRSLGWVFSSKGLLTLLVFLFFILPALQNWRLASLRAQAIRALEEKRGSRAIVMIHRQESFNVLGVPIVRYIDIEDSEAILRAIRLTDPNTPLDLILHTPGGLVVAASQIARAVKRHPAKSTVFVPHYAMSGGTLIAMGAHEIVMDANAVLGPIDPQIGNLPAASVLKVVERKPIERVHDLTLILADQSTKAISQVSALAEELLRGKLPAPQAKEIAHRLASGVWTHDFPITAEAAKELIGLPVSTEVPEEVFRLMTLYPQAQETYPSVYYLPGPGYGPEEPADGEEPARPR
jgi:ClpP class serine protease